MKKIFSVLSVVSLMLLAIVSFCKKALETYFHVMLISNAVNFSSGQYYINAQLCQGILIAVAIICATIALVDVAKAKK